MTTHDQTPESEAQTPSGAADESSAPVDFPVRAKLPFPVVGIGASAGGLEALKRFFGACPADTGMAYVVIQHLPPDHESWLTDILAPCTTMPVHQITAGLAVEPDQVYVIRPGHTVLLKGNTFRLQESVERKGFRRPVDDFFRALAEEQKERAIAVVLSGMGTNGTAGAQAIKAAGGLCIAQEPETAEFPGMPQTLIHAGYADQVLSPEAIPAVLLRYAQQPYMGLDSSEGADAADALEQQPQALNEILTIVRARTGHDFRPYKPGTLLRRVQRRMGLSGIDDLAHYAAQLREKPDEVSALTNDLMINVTGFFRDPKAWEALRVAVVRPLIEGAEHGTTLRAWVAACASGEEPYTLAMLIAEELERLGKRLEVRIFATDTADKSIRLARAGVYPAGIEGDLSADRLEKFFDRDEHVYRIKKFLRDQVVFAPHDVLRDPPFSRVDIVTCRNLLIYLEPEAQRRALALMHFALREGGYLFLGNAETLGQAESLFEVVSKRWRIYRRGSRVKHDFREQPGVSARLREPLAAIRPALASIARPSTPTMIQSALLDMFGPTTAVVDANERAVYFHGNTEPFLQNPVGEVTQNLLDLVRTPFRSAVRSTLRQAIAEKRTVTVEVELAPGRVAITAAPLRLSRVPEHFYVTFVPHDAKTSSHANPIESESAAPPVVQTALPVDAGLEDEIRLLRRELQTSVEAFETTNEELKAANEEVTSMNEELQSANEELETGKEELQALNEELVTVNSQLQSKVRQLESLTSDLDNLLSSTDIAVVFLDTRLRVRRFTPAVSDLLQLIPGDIGRPLEDLAQKFTDGDLLSDAGQVLAKLTPLQAEVHSHSGHWYMRRALPYRTEDHRIAGVVITFVEITTRKHAEQAIAATQERLQAVVEQMPTAVLLVEHPSGHLVLANRRAAQLFQQPYPLPQMGQPWATSFPALRGLRTDGRVYEAKEWPLARALATGETVWDEEFELVRLDGERVTLSMGASPVRHRNGEIVAAVAAFWDVSERKRAQAALRESEERFRLLVESAHDYAIFMLDTQGRVVSWNEGAERVTGYPEQEILGQPGALLFTPEDRANGATEREMRLADSTGRAIDERWHLRKDGSRFWASGVMTLARDAQGALRGYVKVMRDQTERQQIDARLYEALQSAQELRGKAESANRAKDEFISTVSHELRTPLNTIRLWSRMLTSGSLQREDVIKGGQAIDRAALAQEQLIDDLLDVSRIASGQLRIALRDADLNHAIEAALEAIRPMAAARHIAVEVALGPKVGTVRIDPDRIQQVVWNLLTNAVKFSSEGGHVAVRSRRLDGSVEIEVTDTGVGIAPDFLPHVFDRFRQGNVGASRRYGGLGLGLSIARQLVELHGGRIAAYSEGEGRGATFKIELPLESRPAVVAAPPVVSVDANGLEGAEILLVEDDRSARDAITRLLSEYGAQVHAASSAPAARDLFEPHRPHLIVADIGMADEDGYTLMKSLRAIEQQNSWPHTPAVAVTAFARREDRERAIAAGFDEHLRKPLDAERLITLLSQWVRERRVSE